MLGDAARRWVVALRALPIMHRRASAVPYNSAGAYRVALELSGIYEISRSLCVLDKVLLKRIEDNVLSQVFWQLTLATFGR
jgi:hypothetical protein